MLLYFTFVVFRKFLQKRRLVDRWTILSIPTYWTFEKPVFRITVYVINQIKVRLRDGQKVCHSL